MYKSTFQQLMERYENDPQYRAEGALIELTECLCGISQSRKTRIIVWLIERLAGLVIDRAPEEPDPEPIKLPMEGEVWELNLCRGNPFKDAVKAKVLAVKDGYVNYSVVGSIFNDEVETVKNFTAMYVPIGTPLPQVPEVK